jgi:hypothetical protein
MDDRIKGISYKAFKLGYDKNWIQVVHCRYIQAFMVVNKKQEIILTAE